MGGVVPPPGPPTPPPPPPPPPPPGPQPHSLAGQVLRSLSDRNYEKRKSAAQDIEAIIQQLMTAGQGEDVRRLLNFLAAEFTTSANVYHRKGGLAALQAAVHAVSSELDRYLPLLVHPVLKCFEDSDSRVRYYACEVCVHVCASVWSNRVCGATACVIVTALPTTACRT